MSAPNSSPKSSMVYYAPWKKWATIFLCLVSILYAAPNVLPREISKPLSEQYSRWLPVHPVNLGLDLQGGSSILLGVDIEVALRDRMTTMLDSVRKNLLDQSIKYSALQVSGHSITFTLLDTSDAGKLNNIRRDVDSDLTVDTGSDGKVTLALSDAALLRYKQQILEQSIEIVRRRVDESGTKEPIIQRSGEDRILLQLPGVSDPQQVKRLLGQTAKMTFHLVDEAATASGGFTAPDGYVSLPDRDNPQQRVVVRRLPSLSGDTLTNAQASMGTSGPAIHFSFNSVGGRLFADITRQNVGQQFAIVLDGKVLTAPVIREPITGGQGQIDGNFTVESANELALLLRAGALPAPLKVLEERTVGPGLGQDAIDAGSISGIIGFVLVVLWMFVTYGRFGVYANVALAINVAMIFALFSVLGVTLTLPGIAAIILTIGMAVDANVLVYERIREEIRNGRTPLAAVDSGYSRAMPSITDSNLTTIIAGVILYFLGTGPVRGFAVALVLGIVTTLFSAIMITRLMVLGYLRHKKPAMLNI